MPRKNTTTLDKDDSTSRSKEQLSKTQKGNSHTSKKLSTSHQQPQPHQHEHQHQHQHQLHRQPHTKERTRQQTVSTTAQYLRDGIYGGLDGIITTFGCVSGVAGAHLSCWLALILGLANLVADGLSMAVGNYIGTKSEIEFERKQRQREETQIECWPDGERDQLREIFYKKGFRGQTLEMVVDVICSDKKLWVDTLLVEECGILPEEKNPLRAAAVTFVSFNVAGFVPLIVYVAALFFPSLEPMAYDLCVFMTLCAVFALGAFKGWVAGTWWLKSGVEMLMLGSLAAGAAFYIGHILHGIDV